MSDPIKAGDLVVVVHECCDTHEDPWLGRVFTVASVGMGSAACDRCGFSYRGLNVADERTARNGNPRGVPISWVKRIPPIEELDDVKHEEEITA